MLSIRFSRAALLGGLFILLPVTGLSATTGATNNNTAKPEPALSRLVKNVLADYPRVEAARAALAAASARRSAAGQSLYNPSLELDVENGDIKRRTLGVAQTLDWGDKRGALVRIAEADERVAKARLRLTREELAWETLSALGQFHTAQARSRLAERRAMLMTRFENLTVKRRQAGDLEQSALDLARLALVRAQMARARIAAALADSGQRLNALVGEVRTVWPNLPVAFADETNIAAVPTAQVLQALPGMQVLQARVAAARSTLSLRQRARQADPTLSLRGGREGSKALIGLSISVPLYVRNSYSAEAKVAAAELIKVQREAQDAYRQSHSRLVSARQRLTLTQSAWKTWGQTGEGSLDSHLGLLERVWRAGEMSTTDYLVQLNQALDTRDEALHLRGDLWRAWFDWLRATARIESWLGLGAGTRVQQRAGN